MNFSVSHILKSINLFEDSAAPGAAVTPDKTSYTLKQMVDSLSSSGNNDAANAISAGSGFASSSNLSTPRSGASSNSGTGSIFGDLFGKQNNSDSLSTNSAPEQSLIMPSVNLSNHLNINQLSDKTRKVIDTGGLVLVREASDDRRSIGTLWFNKSPIGYTVEDPVRQSKIRNVTAVPAYVYNIGLRTTARTQLNRCAISLGNSLVLPAIGTDSGCVNIKVGNIAFSGCRIHDGVDETWSSGCIIYSDKEVSPGKLVQNPKAVQDLSKLILSNHIDKISVINEFEVNNAR